MTHTPNSGAGLTTFLKNNSWGLITSMFLIAMSVGIWTSKLEQMEFRIQQHDEQIKALQSVAALSIQVANLIKSQEEIKTQMKSVEQDLNRFYREDWVKVERLLFQMEQKKK